MKVIKNMLMAGALVFGTTACDFEDTNVDPASFGPDEVPVSALLPSAQVQVGYNMGALGGRMPGIIMQHFIGLDAQQLPYTDYVIGEVDLNGLWQNGLYGGSMKLSIDILDRAEPAELPHYQGVAKILLAQSLGMATSFWGDVPYSEALAGLDNLSPTFDTQESVYASIQTLLSEAITALEQPAAPGDIGSDDLVFGGDSDAWLKVARSLQARYYIQLTKRDPQAATKALAAISAGALESADDDANIPFEDSPTGANPYAQFGAQRPGTLGVDPQLNASMVDKGDPRIDLYMVEADGAFLYYSDSDPLFWSANGSVLPIISYTEVKFIEAEALLRTGDSAGAEQALFDGIVASFIQLGVPVTDEAIAYLETHGAFTSSNTDSQLEQIMTEKYFALFAQAESEAWVDYRRTGYPVLTPKDGGSNGLNPDGVIPRRFIYPRDERITNADNMEAAISRQGGGLLSDDMWAFGD